MAGDTILVVEDTELLRRIYTDKLTAEGYNVLGAADGLECLAQLHARHVDLVLLDLIMPRMSGLEVLDTMQKDPRTKDIPVVILSNLGQDSDIERGLSMGAVDYLIKNEAKPADVAEKIKLVLHSMASPEVDVPALRVLLRDHEADADRLVQTLKLRHQFWCPACEVQLTLELLPKPDKEGWFDAHLVCPQCQREFVGTHE